MYQFGRFVKIDGEIAFEAWGISNSSEQKEVVTPIDSTPAVEESVTDLPVVLDEPVEEQVKVPTPIVEEPKLEIEPNIVIETPKEEKPQEVEKPTKIIAETPVEKPKADPEATPKVDRSVQVEEVKVVPPVVEKMEPKVSAGNPNSSTDKNRKKEETPKKETIVKTPKEGKKRSVFSYILWGFLVLILGSGIFIALNFNSLKKDFPILADLAGENDNVAKGSEDVKTLEDESEMNNDSEMESEPIPEDQVQVIEDQLPDAEKVDEPKKVVTPKVKKETPAVVAPKPKPVVTVNNKPVTKPKSTTSSSATFDGSKQFHIIAGSFGSETNANKLAGKLQSQGFESTSVTMNNGMYRVSIKGYSTLNEATSEAGKVQSKVPGAWVLKM
jgi:outer membrane biosynthesis protein TonB